jgi:hypothetical protein
MHEKAPSRRHYLNVCKVECARWGVDYALTVGGARWRPAVFVRSRVAKHFLALGYGLAATARTMGMDHTTLLHNRRRSDAEELAYLERGPDGWTFSLYRDREKKHDGRA